MYMYMYMHMYMYMYIYMRCVYMLVSGILHKCTKCVCM